MLIKKINSQIHILQLVNILEAYCLKQYTTLIWLLLQNGKCMHNPEFYSKLTLKDLKDILQGNNSIDIPLLNERLNCLHEVGKVLIDKYDGILLFTIVLLIWLHYIF